MIIMIKNITILLSRIERVDDNIIKLNQLGN